MPSRRRFPVAAAVLCALTLLLPQTAEAGRVEATIPLKGKLDLAVSDAGEPVTVGFLVNAGNKVSIQAKRSKGSSLEPELKLVDPLGNDYVLVPGDKDKANAKSAKLLVKSLPSSGLWRVEINGKSGTVGGFSLAVKGKDATKLKNSDVIPAGGVLDVPFPAGAGVEVTVKAKRKGNRVLVPEIVLLDPNGDEVAGSVLAATSSAKKGSASLKKFLLPVFGEYTLRLAGVNGFGGTVAYSLKTKASKFKGVRPVADPGATLSVEPNITGRLDGSRSTGGGALTYLWSQVSGDPVELSDPQTAMPTFTAPANPGPLAFDLSVSEGGVLSRSVPVSVDVAVAPLADAGASQAVGTGDPVTLSGADSLSRSGAPLTFAWEQLAGDPVVLDDPSAQSPSFTAPLTDGVLRFGLTVGDGTSEGRQDETIVAVGTAAAAVADAGRNQVLDRMATVHLSGLLSTRASGVLDGGFSWRQTHGVGVALDGADTPFPSFTAPRQPADLRFELAVDGAASAADSVWVFVRPDHPNRPPLTRGNGPLAPSGGSATLGAGGTTDADGDTPAFRWAQVAGPPAALGSVDTAAVVATGLASSGPPAVFAAQARDDLVFGPPDLVRVAANTPDALPLAHAGPDRDSLAGSLVRLDGSGSLGATAGYEWEQVSGTDWYDVAASDPGFVATAQQPVFTLPVDVSSLTPTRTISFALRVSDGAKQSPADRMNVRFTSLPLNGRPVVSASATDTNPPADTLVSLVGTANDRDGDPVTVEWRQTAGPAVNISDSTSLSPTVTVPAAGTLTFEITGDDGFEESLPAEVTLVVNERPTAVATVTPPSGLPGTSVTMSATDSSDPEDATLTFSWAQLAGPSVSFDPAAETIQFTAPDGAVTFRLVVNDGAQNSVGVQANFSNLPPPEANPTASLTNAPYGADVTLRANPPANTNFTFTWRQINDSGNDPVITLSSTTAENPTFSVPLPNAAPYGASPKATFGVKANNGEVESDEETVVVTFFASLLNAGNAPGVASGETVFSIIQNNCLSPCHTGNSPSCSTGNDGKWYPLDTKQEFVTNSVNASSCHGNAGSKPRIDGTGKDPDNSWLVDRLKGLGGLQRMPKDRGKLPDRQIHTIMDWITQGVQDN